MATASPSPTRWAPRTPSAGLSRSTLDLSVSISAMTSPAATVSPGCLCHCVRTASVIAMPRAGMFTSCTKNLAHLEADTGVLFV